MRGYLLRSASRGVAAVLALGFVGPSCITHAKFDKQRNAAKHWEEIARGMEANQAQIESENRGLRGRLAELEVTAAKHGAVVEEAKALREEYEKRLREMEGRLGGIEGIGAGDVEVVRGPEGPVVRIKDSVLFDSGSEEVKAGGATILRGIAEEIAAKPSKGIRVEGHTDNDPVTRTKDRYPLGNLQLSAARAVRVASILIREGRIPAEKVSVAGFGEWRPIAGNTTAEGKRRNRRVEIAVLEE